MHFKLFMGFWRGTTWR